MPLDRIYRLFTSLPGSSREYDRTDFARDLYILDTNGPKRTKQGPPCLSRPPPVRGVRRACSPSSDRMAAMSSITDSGLPRAADVENYPYTGLAAEH